MEIQKFTILLIIDNKFEGRYCQDFVLGFQRQYPKVDIIFMSLQKCEPPAWMLNFENCTPLISKSSNFVRRSLSLIWQLRKVRIDIIQTHLFYSGIVGVLIGKILKKPVIHTRHHLDENWQIGTRFHVLVDRFAMRLSQGIVTFSQATKNWIVENENVSAEKVSVINQGFDFTSLQPLNSDILVSQEELNFQKSAFNIICVSRYLEVKGQKVLVDALKYITSKKLVDSIDKPIRIAFVGIGNPEWLETYILASRLEKEITCYRARSDIAACLAAADLVCHPSLADSFSQLIIEAQATGTPIIASRIAGAPEQIIDGVTGIIVTPNCAIELASSIMILQKDIVKALNMGLAGKKHVRESFSLERMINEEYKLLVNLMKTTN